MSIRKPQKIANEQGIGGGSLAFPAGLVLDLNTNHFEDMASVAPKWDQEYLKLGKEPFSGRLLVIHSARVQMGIISWNPGILIRGSAPPQAFTFALVLAKEGPTSFQGTELRENCIVVLQPRGEFEFSAVGKCKVLVVGVEQDLLQSHVLACWGSHRLMTDGRDRLVVKNSFQQRSFNTIWEMMLAEIGRRRDRLANPNFSYSFEHNVLEQLLTNSHLVPSHGSGPHCYQAARKAKEYLFDHITDPVSIRELCEAVNASERSLLSGFRQVFGISPKLYLKSLRLNRVRQDLRKATEETRITDIAFRWGLTHLSRFAADYRQMFGEYPHETLRSSSIRNQNSSSTR